MRKHLGLLCLVLINASLSAQERPYVLMEDVRIPMRDGTTLAGFISHPTNVQKAPVLLQLNSYPRPNDVQSTQHIKDHRSAIHLPGKQVKQVTSQKH